jgi:DNA-binding NarL/FixJ family response regulator
MARYFSPEPLTPRERGVLHLVGKGMTNRQIATSLCITEATVENHLSRIYGKLGVHNRMFAVRIAWHYQWILWDGEK